MPRVSTRNDGNTSLKQTYPEQSKETDEAILIGRLVLRFKKDVNILQNILLGLVDIRFQRQTV